MASIELAITAIATIMASIVAITNVLTYLIKKQEQRIYFKLTKNPSHVTFPIESNMAIIVDHPDKVIEKCKVFGNSTPIPYNKIGSELVYEQLICAMGSETYRIPASIEDDDLEIIVKNGKKRLKPPIKLKDVPNH